MRVAVTGRTVGPPLFESLELLGPRDRRRSRRLRPLQELTEVDGDVGRRARRRRRRSDAGRRCPDRSATAAVAAPAARARPVLLVVLAGGYYAVTLWLVTAPATATRPDRSTPSWCMGAAQYDGRPSPQLAARLDHVVELWQQGLAPLVVVTGGKQPGDRFTEAEASADYLVDRGVPAEAIVQEASGAHLVRRRCAGSRAAAATGPDSRCCWSATRSTRCASG